MTLVAVLTLAGLVALVVAVITGSTPVALGVIALAAVGIIPAPAGLADRAAAGAVRCRHRSRRHRIRRWGPLRGQSRHVHPGHLDGPGRSVGRRPRRLAANSSIDPSLHDPGLQHPIDGPGRKSYGSPAGVNTSRPFFTPITEPQRPLGRAVGPQVTAVEVCPDIPRQ